jgi:6-phosphogluconolactonase/glucosamine-6-phosphate isomerase/deaminase
LADASNIVVTWGFEEIKDNKARKLVLVTTGSNKRDAANNIPCNNMLKSILKLSYLPAIL